MNKLTVILLRAHRFDEVLRLQFEELKASCGVEADVVLLYHGSRNDPGVRDLDEADVFAHSDEDCEALGLPFESVWFNGHYPLLVFARARPGYAWHWMLEYDVRFTGQWSDLLLRSFSDDDADLLATDVRHNSSQPNWYWWPHRSNDLALNELWACFFPLLRFTSRALQTLDLAHQSGTHGFCEVVVPSVLIRAGLVVRDLNVTQENLYNRRTWRWRPYRRRTGSGRAMLYHPVVEGGTLGAYIMYRLKFAVDLCVNRLSRVIKRGVTLIKWRSKDKPN